MLSVLAVIEVRLMLAAIKHGPETGTPVTDDVAPAGAPNPFQTVAAE